MLARSKIANAAGARNNYITIQRATDQAANSVSEVLPQFATLCQRWASTESQSGREFVAARQVQPLLRAIYKIPYDPVTATISPRDQVVDGSRTLHIDAVFNENENNEKIVMWIIEQVES